ncbi:MAG: YkgJ family cysteine cluster protein [Deltaproteobacteria bacterium]
MTEQSQTPQDFSQTGARDQGLAAYFSARARLASAESDFHCDPACTRPGCRNQDLQVPVNLFDLLGAARHREASVSAFYPGHYSLGLLSTEGHDWIKTVSLRLKKPCPFLEADLCSIYPVRPLPCVLFPEYLGPAGAFAACADKEYFRDYLCLRRAPALSPARGRVIAELRRMWEREKLISNFYLFNHGSCHVDFGNLIKELSDEGASVKNSEAEPGRGQIISNQVIEGFFLKHIAKFLPFSGLNNKILQLQESSGAARLWQLLQDDRLVARLRREGRGRALVFRFHRGRLRFQRRSLIPEEYKFY